MSENVIYCYSGSGHCLDMAKRIAAGLGDTDIVMMRRQPAMTDATGAKRVGFVFPCYGGGLPGDVESYIRGIKIAPGAYTFAVEQYAGYMGCGLHKIDQIVGLDYWAKVSNFSTCIWLMPPTLTAQPGTPDEVRARIERTADEVAAAARELRKSDVKPPKKGIFAAESKLFAGAHTKRTGKFHASDACVGCGTCVRVCPRDNIRLVEGKPTFGTDCIGCLGCVQYCPKKALDVGEITKKRDRYPNRNVGVAELTQEVIHVD